MEAILKQIEENVNELKIRLDGNQARIKEMKGQNFKPAMYKDHELEIARIAGQIDTFISCYQMIQNR